MPYDRDHVLFQWGGTLPGGEIWSCSLRGAGSQTGADGAFAWGPVNLQAHLTDVWAPAVSAYHARTTTRIHSACKLTFLKANVIKMDGHYRDPVTHEHVFAPVVGGGVSTTQHPDQIAWAVSLTTAISRGPAHRGRFYLPLPGITLDANGLAAVSDCISVAASTKTFLEAMADTTGLDSLLPFKILVMSAAGAAGAAQVVTGVEVGQVLDTQRRRRSALLENYQAAAVDQGLD